MKKILTVIAVSLAMLLTAVFADIPPQSASTFEKAVEIIKKYETLHSPSHWPFVGYGHLVMKGESFKKGKRLSEKEADALLRKDLRKLCVLYRDFGADSIILATLAYNCGPGTVKKSSVFKKLQVGERDIAEAYIAHCRYRGKAVASIKRRRQEELSALFTP